MEIIKIDNYNVINLIDGNLILDAIKLINSKQADGINFNFIKNFPKNIEEITLAPDIKYIQINDYNQSREFDYSAIHNLIKLSHLSIYTSDNKEINYNSFPNLESTALFWRPKAKSIFQCDHLKNLFLGKYNKSDLNELENLNKLEYLRINTGSIKTLKGIEKMKSIKELWLMQATKLEDISEISKLTNLKYLRIDNCKKVNNINIIHNLKITTVQITGTTPKTVHNI